MANQAPVFRPPGWKPPVPWQRSPGYQDKRKRGWQAYNERKKLLKEEPLCRLCRAAAVVIDHIKPLAFGGGEERSNKQSLCKACHDAKTGRESAEGRRRMKE
jgi:5-methylcytosine-specific restriction enzyme A